MPFLEENPRKIGWLAQEKQAVEGFEKQQETNEILF